MCQRLQGRGMGRQHLMAKEFYCKEIKTFCNQIDVMVVQNTTEFFTLKQLFLCYVTFMLINYLKIMVQNIFSYLTENMQEPSVQFSSVAQSCSTPCYLMNHSTPGLPVHHQLPESSQTHVHRVNDTIQLSHPLSSPSPPALNIPHHQGLFQ